MEIEEQECENCNKMIPSEKHTLHEAYCLRNMKKCLICLEVFIKNEMSEHL